MKITTLLSLTALTVFSGISSFAQGALTPPAGAPAPVMKSLDQIETRTPLVAGQPGVFVGADNAIYISASGSYYLTQNLVISNANTTAITIGSQTDVMLDLNGFSILCTNTGSSGIAAAILISGSSGQTVVIRNGFIRGGGTNSIYGIRQSPILSNVLVDNVHIFNVKYGIALSHQFGQTTAHHCSVERTGMLGIEADIVTDCTVATVQGDSGIGINGSQVSGCVVNSGPYPSIGIQGQIISQSYVSRGNLGLCISAYVANGCLTSGGTNIINYKYNMP